MGSPATKPQGTLATGAPASVQGELNGISGEPVRHRLAVEHDRLVADQRRQDGHLRVDEQVVAVEHGSQLAEIELLRAQARHVGGRGQQQPGEQPCCGRRARIRTNRVRSQPRWACAASGSIIVWTIVPACSSSGTVDRLDPSAERPQLVDGGTGRRRDLGVGAVEELLDHPDPKPAGAGAELGPVRRGERLEQQAAVLRRPRHRADRVEPP